MKHFWIGLISLPVLFALLLFTNMVEVDWTLQRSLQEA